MPIMACGSGRTDGSALLAGGRCASLGSCARRPWTKRAGPRRGAGSTCWRAGSGVVPDDVVAELLAPPVGGASAAVLLSAVASDGAVAPDRGGAPGSAA